MNVLIKKNDIYEFIIFIMLFLFAISFYNMAGYFLPILLLFYLIIRQQKKITISQTLSILFFFSVFYFMDYMFFWSITVRDVILYLVAPWGSYLFGLNFVKESNDEHRLGKMVLILSGGLFLHGVLNLYSFYITYGFDYALRRAIDFWRNEEISVTGCSLYYVPAMSLALGYLFFGERKHLKLLSVITIVIGFGANIIYSNRTAVYLLGSLLTIAVVSKMRKDHAKLKSWLVLLGIILTLTIVIVFNLGGIITVINNSGIMQRMRGNETGRLSIWISFLKGDWYLHPFGGDKVLFDYNFAHNLWLDIYRTVGFLPFVLCCIFAIQVVFLTRKFITVKNNNVYYIYLILGIAISCFVEPIMDSNPYYFISAVMIVGGMEGYIIRETEGALKNTI